MNLKVSGSKLIGDYGLYIARSRLLSSGNARVPSAIAVLTPAQSQVA